LFYTILTPWIWQSDFWLFAALKELFEGIHFTCDAEVQTGKVKWFRKGREDFLQISKNFFASGVVLSNERMTHAKEFSE